MLYVVFTRSNNVSQSVIKDYSCSPDKVVCVYAGSNAANVTTSERDYNNKNILFVGIDWQRKGGPELVEAFKKVLTHHPDARLTIVGCSPAIDLPNCDIVGRVPLEKVSPFYEKSSIFCLPTTLGTIWDCFYRSYVLQTTCCWQQTLELSLILSNTNIRVISFNPTMLSN